MMRILQAPLLCTDGGSDLKLSVLSHLVERAKPSSLNYLYVCGEREAHQLLIFCMHSSLGYCEQCCQAVMSVP